MNTIFPIAVFIGVMVFTFGIGIALFYKNGLSANEDEKHDFPQENDKK